MKKVAINGFGRIGRSFFRKTFDNPHFEVVAVNDLGDVDNLAYLLQYDTVYRQCPQEVTHEGDYLIVDNHKVRVLQEKDPGKLPWKDLDIDVVVESTGIFTTLEKAQPHLDAGAKRVVISAPAKDDVTPTVTPNVGMDQLEKERITSNASCTTNAVSPVMAIMSLKPGVKKAVLNTVHGYTATQGLVDGPTRSKDFRKGRAAAQNLIPTSTGAASATARALPELKDKFDGIAIRVPVVTGSIMDVTFIAEHSTTVEEINHIFRQKAADPDWSDILSVTDQPIVSSDIIGNTHGSIVDLSMTRVVDGDLVKVLAWYDNEWGYVSMLEKHVQTVLMMV